MEYPSKTGTTCVTPSPESSTTPVSFPLANLSEADLQREDSLRHHVGRRYLELLEEDLQHTATVPRGIRVCFRQQHGALTRRHPQLSVGVFPNQFHVVPTLHHSMAHGAPQSVEPSFVGLQFAPNVRVHLIGGTRDHHAVFRTAHPESARVYIVGNFYGFFSSPLKPTFMKPVPFVMFWVHYR
jgi:hypothetical protein